MLWWDDFLSISNVLPQGDRSHKGASHDHESRLAHTGLCFRFLLFLADASTQAKSYVAV